MNPCACCGLSARGGSMVVAIFSMLTAVVTGVTLVIEQFSIKPRKKNLSTNQFILLGLHHFMLVVVSLMLFAGAYYKKMYWCIPWIVSEAITIAIYIILIAAMAVNTFSHPVVYLMVAFVLASLMLLIPVYFLWIVVRFVGKLRKEEGNYEEIKTDYDMENTIYSKSQKRHKAKGKSKKKNNIQEMDTYLLKPQDYEYEN